MFDLPIPYRDELIYSVIARYGVYSLELSPKQLIYNLLGSKTFVAAVALQGHLQLLASHYQGNAKLTAEKLLKQYTLYPLYAPFVHPVIAQRVKNDLLSGNGCSAELQLGKAASVVKSPVYLKYCPRCLAMQLDKYKEWYWHRLWQAPGVVSCPVHGSLMQSAVHVHSLHKHVFSALNPSVLPAAVAEQLPDKFQRLARYTQVLLDAPEVDIYPEQWSAFYRALATRLGLNHGKHIDHTGVSHIVHKYWGALGLSWLGLSIDDGVDSNWLKTLFRKHRKAFSYLQHLLVLQAFFDEHLDIAVLLTDVSKMDYSQEPGNQPAAPPHTVELAKRQNWQHAVARFGVKGARQSGFSDLYIWLYRHDKSWLMAFNQAHTKQGIRRKPKVDWCERDLAYVKRLIRLRNTLELSLEVPRLTKNWYFLHVNIPLSQIKQLEKLPLCKLFFNKYCETIEEYQCRRIAVACINCVRHHHDYRSWRIQRLARLSKDRIRPITAELLGSVVTNEANEQIQKSTR